MQAEPVNPFPIIKAAAHGDLTALRLLRSEAWEHLASGREEFGSIALVYGRLAAAHGVPSDRALLAGMLTTIARSHAAAGNEDMASKLNGEALAHFGFLDATNDPRLLACFAQLGVDIVQAVEGMPARDVQYASAYKELMKC